MRTLIATPDPQPGQPTPDPAPVTGSPWGQRYCCPLAAGGDWCDCREIAAEVSEAFGNPIYLGGGAW